MSKERPGKCHDPFHTIIAWWFRCRPRSGLAAAGLLILTLLSGCLFPDDFDVKAALGADGS